MNPLLVLMHDTAHDLGGIVNNIDLIKNRLKELNIEDNLLNKRIQRMEESRINLMKNLDIYYKQTKK